MKRISKRARNILPNKYKGITYSNFRQSFKIEALPKVLVFVGRSLYMVINTKDLDTAINVADRFTNRNYGKFAKAVIL